MISSQSGILGSRSSSWGIVEVSAVLDSGYKYVKSPDVSLSGGVEACVVSNILSIIGIPQTTQLQGSVKDFAQIVYETYIAGELDAEKASLEHQYKCWSFFCKGFCRD